MSERDNSTAVLLSFILGGIVGAGVALLYAPGSGDQTRRKLRYLAEEFGEKTSDGFKEIYHRAEDGIHDLRGRVEDAVDHGREGVKHQKDRISAAVEAGRKAYKEEQEGRSDK